MEIALIPFEDLGLSPSKSRKGYIQFVIENARNIQKLDYNSWINHKDYFFAPFDAFF